MTDRNDIFVHDRQPLPRPLTAERPSVPLGERPMRVSSRKALRGTSTRRIELIVMANQAKMDEIAEPQ
jgi:hypothetical protein